MPQIQSAVQASNASQVGTNQIIISAGEGQASGGALTADGPADVLIPVLTLRDNATDAIRFAVRVPLGMTSISGITIQFLRTHTGNAFLQFWTGHVDTDIASAIVEDTSDAFTAYPGGGSDSKIASITVPAAAFSALNSIDQGDIIILQVNRDSVDATDTYVNPFEVVSATFTFA